MITRMRTVITAGVLAAAGSAAAIAVAVIPASAGTASPSAAAAGKVVVVNACTGAGQVRPRGYEPGCMPSSEYFTKLSWTTWGSTAYGHGVMAVNNCTP